MCIQTFNFQHLLLKPVHDSPFRTFSVTSPRATGDVKDLGKRQRKLLYRCKQRGLLELDLLLGIPSVLWFLFFYTSCLLVSFVFRYLLFTSHVFESKMYIFVYHIRELGWETHLWHVTWRAWWVRSGYSFRKPWLDELCHGERRRGLSISIIKHPHVVCSFITSIGNYNLTIYILCIYLGDSHTCSGK